ncbi:MAG: DMT family transporter [bacterium]|nr:DMT family transporter [bacterium]
MRQLVYVFAVIVQGSAWGAQFVMLKLAAEGDYDELTVLFIAMFLVSACYFVILLVRRSSFRQTPKSIEFFAITGLLGYALPLTATLYAAPHLPAGVITLIVCFTPMISIVVALLARTERVSRTRLVAMALGMAAAVMVLAPQLSLPGLGVLEWMLLVGLVPLCYGIESIYVDRHWPEGFDIWQVGFGEAAAAMILVAPLVIVFGEPLPDLAWSTAETGIVLFTLIGLVEIVIYFWIISRTGGVLVNFSVFAALFAGIAWGMIIFGERHDVAVWGAAAVLLAAMALLALEAMRTDQGHR